RTGASRRAARGWVAAGRCGGCGSAGGAAQDHGVDAPGDELAVPDRAEEPSAVGDRLAPKNRGDGPARDRPALPRAVVAHVEVVLGERLPDRRVEQDEVRVAARGDDTLPRVEPEDPRGVRRGDGGEALERHAALDDALGERDAEARLRPEVAARHV